MSKSKSKNGPDDNELLTAVALSCIAGLKSAQVLRVLDNEPNVASGIWRKDSAIIVTFRNDCRVVTVRLSIDDKHDPPAASDFEGDGKLNITGGMDSAEFVRRL